MFPVVSVDLPFCASVNAVQFLNPRLRSQFLFIISRLCYIFKVRGSNSGPENKMAHFNYVSYCIHFNMILGEGDAP